VIELRRVGVDEWQLWRDVRLRALREAPYAFGSTLAQWEGEGLEARWRARLEDVSLNLVAIAGESAVGQVSGTAPDEGGRVELLSMWVDPSARGTGVGDALIGGVVAWAEGSGASAVALSVKAGNERAIALYERMGFERIDEPADEGEFRMLRRGRRPSAAD
jgi:ribosomal protein S18 acetylase RimI-like enzyme